jgi:hypothetical protein
MLGKPPHSHHSDLYTNIHEPVANLKQVYNVPNQLWGTLVDQQEEQDFHPSEQFLPVKFDFGYYYPLDLRTRADLVISTAKSTSAVSTSANFGTRQGHGIVSSQTTVQFI